MSTDQPARILSINTQEKTMIINWGDVTLNHDIPLRILENHHLSEQEVREAIEAMRPPKPVDYEVPLGLLQMVEQQTTPEDSADQTIEGEAFL